MNRPERVLAERSTRRRICARPTTLEGLAALARLSAERSDDIGARIWRRIANLFERSPEMEAIFSAYDELVRDETCLLDPEAVAADRFAAAVPVHLERDNGGAFHIDVPLKQIEGSQLAFVLGIGRKYELDVREESGYLRLDRHLTSADVTEDEREPEVVEA